MHYTLLINHFENLKMHIWTDEQLKYLHEWYPHWGVKYCAESLQIPVGIVKSKIDKLKIKKLTRTERLCPVCKVNYQVPHTAHSRNNALCATCLSKHRKETRTDKPYVIRQTMTYKLYFMTTANTLNYRNRKKHNSDIRVTAEDLISIYEKQNGKCFYSGVLLDMPYGKDTLEATKAGSMYPYTISVDRYDSAYPYTIENIRFCTYQVNIAKNSFTSEQFLLMCSNVSLHNNL